MKKLGLIGLTQVKPRYREELLRIPNTTEHVRRTAAKAVVAALSGILAAVIALPALANAAPITSTPGMLQLDIPVVVAKKHSKSPARKAKKPKPQINQTPEVPTLPDVSSSTGWVALADDKTHSVFWWHNGIYKRKMPISMGTNKHPTPNGTYHTKEKYRMIIMDSSTYGVPVNSPEGYKTPVNFAIRMSWDGIFIHAAPWSVAQQGRSNTSHGCINLSEPNAKWMFDNIPRGTPIIVRGTVGGGNWRTPRD